MVANTMDQSPTDSYADSGLWKREQKPSTTAKSRGGVSTSGRQITRNRASYSCHSCRRRKVKCDKVRILHGLGSHRPCHILICTGPSSLRELREERKRMRIRCRATKRYWIACRTSERWWIWREAKKRVEAGGGRC